MSRARDLIYAFVDNQIKKGEPIKAGTFEDDYLHALLDKVQLDSAHHIAEGLRAENSGCPAEGVCDRCAFRTEYADRIDPYEKTTDGLADKWTGKAVIL